MADSVFGSFLEGYARQKAAGAQERVQKAANLMAVASEYAKQLDMLKDDTRDAAQTVKQAAFEQFHKHVAEASKVIGEKHNKDLFSMLGRMVTGQRGEEEPKGGARLQDVAAGTERGGISAPPRGGGLPANLFPSEAEQRRHGAERLAYFRKMQEPYWTAVKSLHDYIVQRKQEGAFTETEAGKDPEYLRRYFAIQELQPDFEQMTGSKVDLAATLKGILAAPTPMVEAPVPGLGGKAPTAATMPAATATPYFQMAEARRKEQEDMERAAKNRYFGALAEGRQPEEALERQFGHQRTDFMSWLAAEERGGKTRGEALESWAAYQERLARARRAPTGRVTMTDRGAVVIDPTTGEATPVLDKQGRPFMPPQRAAANRAVSYLTTDPGTRAAYVDVTKLMADVQRGAADQDTLDYIHRHMMDRFMDDAQRQAFLDFYNKQDRNIFREPE